MVVGSRSVTLQHVGSQQTLDRLQVYRLGSIPAGLAAMNPSRHVVKCFHIGNRYPLKDSGCGIGLGWVIQHVYVTVVIQRPPDRPIPLEGPP
jgi:hypothetical protein